MISGRITFDTVGTGIEVPIGFDAECVELTLGSYQDTNEDGVYWSYGIGDTTYMDAVSICGRAGVTPNDRTRNYTDRILVARRKVSGVMTTVLEVSLADISNGSLFFDVHTANVNLSPVLKAF